MVWADDTRINYDNQHMRYSSDCTDAESQIISPFLERQRKVDHLRKQSDCAIWDAIWYLAATGCQRDQFPKDFTPFTTVQYYFYRLRDSGLLDVIHEALIAFIGQIDERGMETTASNLLTAIVYSVDILDRDRSCGIIELTWKNYPTMTKLMTDGGYAGNKLATVVVHIKDFSIDIIRRLHCLNGFVRSMDAHRFNPHNDTGYRYADTKNTAIIISLALII